MLPVHFSFQPAEVLLNQSPSWCCCGHWSLLGQSPPQGLVMLSRCLQASSPEAQLPQGGDEEVEGRETQNTGFPPLLPDIPAPSGHPPVRPGETMAALRSARDCRVSSTRERIFHRKHGDKRGTRQQSPQHRGKTAPCHYIWSLEMGAEDLRHIQQMPNSQPYQYLTESSFTASVPTSNEVRSSDHALSPVFCLQPLWQPLQRAVLFMGLETRCTAGVDKHFP